MPDLIADVKINGEEQTTGSIFLPINAWYVTASVSDCAWLVAIEILSFEQHIATTPYS